MAEVVSCTVDYTIDNSLAMDCSQFDGQTVECWDDLLAAVTADSATISGSIEWRDYDQL